MSGYANTENVFYCLNKSHFDSGRLVDFFQDHSYLQVYIMLHHDFNNLQDFLPIISVRKVWKEILIIHTAFLINKQKELPKNFTVSSDFKTKH